MRVEKQRFKDLATTLTLDLGEVGESGTYHFQIYVEFTKQLTLSRIKELFDSNSIHVEPRRGTQKQAIAYCCKPDNYRGLSYPDDTRVEGPWFFGEAKQQGLDQRLMDLKQLADTGKTKLDMYESDFPTTLRHARNLDDYLLHAKLGRFTLRSPTSPILVEVHIGEPGTGKTELCKSTYPSHFVKNSSKWFDGYNGQQCVIFDDYYGGVMPASDFNQLLQPGIFSFEIKNGFYSCTSTQFCFTSNRWPHLWWMHSKTSPFQSFARRVSTWYFHRKGVEPVAHTEYNSLVAEVRGYFKYPTHQMEESGHTCLDEHTKLENIALTLDNTPVIMQLTEPMVIQ